MIVDIKDIKQLVSNSSTYSPEEILEESSLIGDLDYDSFALLDLLMAFEQRFSIKIPDRDIRLFITVKDIVDYLAKL